jgi:ABC-type sugar transport system ATPase subunit
VLQAEGIQKRFGPVQALGGVSFTAVAGEVHALLGENGAGKSTLLRILSGEHVPDEGTLTLDGVPIQLGSPHEAVRAGIRVISQEPEILSDVTVAENVFIGQLPHSRHFVRRRDMNERASQLIGECGFNGLLSATALGSSLSPAQRQLVEILRALRQDVRVIAFDEPTSSLSDTEVQALFTLIRQLRARGVAIIYVSHRMKEIFDLSDRVTVLRDGQDKGTRALGETTEGELIRMMVGRDLENMFERSSRPRADVVLLVNDVSTDDVHNISFDIHAGEVVGLAGLVGAGRTELAHALAGDTRITSGSISVEGRRLQLRSPKDAIRAGICLAPEERKAQALLLDRSVRDNTTLAVLRRLSTGGIVNRRRELAVTREFVDRLSIRTSSAEAPVSTLSGGNQQKVVLARWLARHPTVLILDEPTRGVDIGAKVDIYRIINQLAEQGVAILMISSELPEIIGVADRVLVMNSGRIVGELSRDQADEASILQLAISDDTPEKRSA